jgi:hypothetical protein
VRLPDIVISESPWRAADGRQARIPAGRGSSCASRTSSGARSTRRFRPSTPCRGVSPRCPSGSAISSSPMLGRSSESRSREPGCVMPPAARRTGSGGASPALCAAPLRAGANPAANASPHLTWPKVFHRPRNRGNSRDPLFHRLSVAYGLSFDARNIGGISSPGEAPNLPPQPRRRFDDHYISKDQM